MGIRESVTLGVGNTLSDVVNLEKFYRNTYGNRGIGNSEEMTHGIGRVNLKENLYEYL